MKHDLEGGGKGLIEYTSSKDTFLPSTEAKLAKYLTVGNRCGKIG